MASRDQGHRVQRLRVAERSARFRRARRERLSAPAVRDSQIKQRGYKIVNVRLTYTAPMGFYSKKIKSLKNLPVRAKVTFQNDPSNGNCALLPQKYGVNTTPLDVAENPKKIKIVEPDSAQLPRTLPDVDAASINIDYVVKMGLTPVKNVIVIEDLRGAVREPDRGVCGRTRISRE